MRLKYKASHPNRDESYSRDATHVAVQPTFAAVSGGSRHNSSLATPGRNRLPALPARTLCRLSENCKTRGFPFNVLPYQFKFIIINPLNKIKCVFTINIFCFSRFTSSKLLMLLHTDPFYDCTNKLMGRFTVGRNFFPAEPIDHL